MPPCSDSCRMFCSILRCSSFNDSWRVFSSSCRRFSSSWRAWSQLRIDSSALRQSGGGAGSGMKDGDTDELTAGDTCTGGEGPAKLIAAGRGKPR
jgi:hypothetical protein